MTNKRYQVFVSSTYADLKEERSRVIQTLMEMDCIPAGMELFPAIDEEQWTFIKKVIDDCDYYIVIIGGRYGSMTSEGISYTEKEYDYAIERGLKVIAFLHENPDDIPVGKSDTEKEIRDRLIAFRDKVATGRLVKTWTRAEELPGLVSLSLTKTIKNYPAIGWLRADQVSSTETLAELNGLRKRNLELEQQAITLMSSVGKAVEIPNLAGLDEPFTVTGTHWYNATKYDWNCDVTWSDLFSLIAPYLLQHPNDEYVKSIYSSDLHKRAINYGTTPSIDDQPFQTIKIQLMALGLIDVQYLKTVQGGMALFWSLTELGKSQLLKIRAVKSKTQEQ